MTTMTPDRTLTSQSAAAILSGEFDKSQLLLPYQKRWIADSSQLKIAEKSRRTGLTWAEAADAAQDVVIPAGPLGHKRNVRNSPEIRPVQWPKA